MGERTLSFSIPEARCEPRIRAESELLGSRSPRRGLYWKCSSTAGWHPYSCGRK